MTPADEQAAPVRERQQIWHGRGTVSRTASACEALGIARPCLVTAARRRHAATIASFLPGPVVVLDLAQDHCPAETVAAACRRTDGADGFVAVGGGAAIGLGKALAFRTGLPLIAIATTFAGSALTDSFGTTGNGEKRVVRSERARPAVSIHDADLFDGFEGQVALASGMNAIAHAMETMVRPEAARSHELARSAIAKLDLSLLRERHPNMDLAVDGALEAARCLAAHGPGLHHRMCHYLGGRYGTPHAATHARLLPSSIALHSAVDRDFARAMEATLSTGGPVHDRLQRILNDAGLGGGLHAMGVPLPAIEELVELAVEAGHPRERAASCLGPSHEGRIASVPR